MRVTQRLRNLLIKAYPVFTGCAACPEQHAIPWREMRSRLPAPSFPIDLVFTWVDGSDPVLAAKRAHYLAGEARPDVAHFRDNDELRFALRAWETYAPWVRRIHIVTDGQTPTWLRTAHPKIRVVDHTACIPAAYLPTFSSRVIEAHLHLIPDVSEHFIYCNDDFFLVSRCEPSDFFTANGLPYAFTDWRASRRAGYESQTRTVHAASYHNTRKWLAAGGLTPAPRMIVAHMPHPLTLTDMAAAHAFYEEAVRTFARDKFRTPRGLVFPCHAVPLLGYAMKRVVPRDMPFYYINSKRFDRNTYYAAMLAEKDRETLPPFLCLNDVGDAPPGHRWRADMHNFLAAFYPTSSAYER